MKRKIFIAILFTGLLDVQAQSNDKYQVQDHNQLEIEVKGVVCSFCAYGTEKNLARLDFVEPKLFGGDGVLLDLENAAITLALQKDKAINFGYIVQAIEKGGYVPVAIHLQLNGLVVKQNRELFIQDERNGQLFRLLTDGDQPWNEESSVGKKVSIQGVIPAAFVDKDNAPDIQAVRVKEFKPAMN